MKKLMPVEYKNQRILTTQLLAENYEASTITIQQNFNNNEKRYVVGKHYYLLQGEELREFKRNLENFEVAPNVNKLYLWTEKGALLHAKSLNTDVAWRVYDELVESYFRKEEAEQNIFDGISVELKAIIMQDKKIQAVEKRIGNLENTMTVDYGQQLTLNNIAGKIATDILGGKESKAYKEISKKVFSAIWRAYKNHFNVSSYKDTPVLKFDEAKVYLSNWLPDYNLLLEIKELNDSLDAAV